MSLYVTFPSIGEIRIIMRKYRNGNIVMFEYEPKTSELQEIIEKILENGALGIYCFISLDRQSIAAIIERRQPLGFKRILYQAALWEDVIGIEKGLVKAIQEKLIDNPLVVVEF